MWVRDIEDKIIKPGPTHYNDIIWQKLLAVLSKERYIVSHAKGAGSQVNRQSAGQRRDTVQNPLAGVVHS